MWTELRARLKQAVANARLRRAPRLLAAVRETASRLPQLPLPRLQLPTRRPSRPQLSRIRIVRAGNRPMRVVFEQAVVHEKYSLRARVLQRGARLVLKPLLSWMPLNDRTLRTMRSIDKLSARGPRSRYVEPYQFELGGVRVESMTHRYGPSSDMTVLYLHGGGFFSCGIETHRRACERLALYTGGQVISVDYIQLPEGTVADSVQDAINAYEALLEMVERPDKIVVAGDSAGGYLTMKIAELATRRGLTPPAALLTFSPLLSLDPDRDDKAIERVSRMRDAYLPKRRIALVRERWIPEGSSIEGYSSPLLAAAYITSPAFFVAAEDEMLRPEVEAMALQLAERGVDVETHLWRGQIHAFPVLADAIPESRQALKLAADFARVAVGELERKPAVDPDSHEEPIVGEIVNEDPGPGVEEVIDVELEGETGRKRWFFQAS
ncbi:MAG: alpha/beta hydrolase [Aeromicrobium sp.]